MYSKLKIGIIELTRSHHQVAELCKYANPDKNDIRLFTSDKILKRTLSELGTYHNKITIFSKANNQSYFSFIRSINRICKSEFDFVIINTVSRWEFVFLKTRCTTFSYFYSFNFWFKDTKESFSKRLLRFNFRYLNLISFLPNRFHVNPIFGTIIRRRILKSIDGVLVEYPCFITYLQNIKNVRKPVYFLPNSYFKNYDNNSLSDKKNFVIPGMISELRRTYTDVLKSFEKLPLPQLKQASLILLGRPIGSYGVQIIQRLKKLEHLGLEIKYFEEFISHDEFSEILSRSDIIIAPVNFDYKSGLIKERFTYTKGTGTFTDMIQYAKPTIVPDEYNIASEFQDCFLTYKDSEDLCNLIKELIIDDEKLKQIKEKTVSLMSKYTLNQMQKKFNTILSGFSKK